MVCTPHDDSMENLRMKTWLRSRDSLIWGVSPYRLVKIVLLVCVFFFRWNSSTHRLSSPQVVGTMM